MEKTEKVTFIHSISAKITLLTIIVVVLAVSGVMINAGIESKKAIGDVGANYVLSMAELSADVLDQIPEGRIFLRVSGGFGRNDAVSSDGG